MNDRKCNMGKGKGLGVTTITTKGQKSLSRLSWRTFPGSGSTIDLDRLRISGTRGQSIEKKSLQSQDLLLNQQNYG